jgi:hypothetical protein
LLDLAARDDDLAVLHVAAIGGELKHPEDKRPQHEKVRQGLAEKPA